MPQPTKRIRGKEYIKHRTTCVCCQGTKWVENIYRPVPPLPAPPPAPPKPIPILSLKEKNNKKRGWKIDPHALSGKQTEVYELVRKYPGKNYKQLWSKSGYKINLGSLTILLTLMYQAGVFSRIKYGGALRYYIREEKEKEKEGHNA